MRNIQGIIFLRNGQLYGSRDAAREAITNHKSQLHDGEGMLARYREEGEGKTVKTLFAVAYISGDTKDVTIFDVEGASSDVNELRQQINAKLGEGITSANTVTSQLTALSGDTASTSADTSVEGAKRYADELKSGMDYTGVTTGDGVVIVNVTEADGIVAATAANVGGLKLTDYTKGSESGSVASTDTINQAMSKLEKQIEAEADARAAAIDDLDLEVVSGDGEVIISVAEDNGKVSATKSAVKDIKLTGYENTEATGAILDTDDIEDALSKLENNISASQSATTLSAADKSITVVTGTAGTTVALNIREGERVLKLDTDATSGGVYTNLNLVKISDDLPETIKERYELRDSDDAKIGESIDIPKDSHIVSITYITEGEHAQNLEYVYMDVSGNTQTTYVDMSELVIEAEFASGVTVTDGVAHGVVDPTSEAFLTVGADGFKISGVSGLVTNAVEALSADVSGNSTHVTVGVAEEDGVITAVTVAEDNIANADDLAELSAKTVTALTSTNGSITAQINDAVGCKTYDIKTDADKIQMSGFSADNTSALSGIVESDSIATAFEKTNAVITENERITAEALTDLDERINELSGGSETSLSDEIAARKAVDGINGSAYTATVGANYISDATSLNDADQKLDSAIHTVATNYVSGITVNGSGVTVTNNIAPIVINASDSNGDGNGIIVRTSEGGVITLALGLLDAGTYDD
jgi:hypothetical protein